ncbi:hypothetical protein OIDMADRAFT_117162 [Oidiodendron maius Zn]|uniref:D-isomer specific 2-hydroxyacid dehydrogenase NAD-binding domain-containing protein n=1 Tax=Oidiodendron maius (strain Zn) TaxID=913774 RepID=A0A0C3H570_OIDMZ|nr:hypothetical protein OIDMADRAFT_117162 [Oidiodendron maius Zn]
MRKPTLLLIASPVREIDDVQWQRVADTFNIIVYDCGEDLDMFISRLRPGGQYAHIEAIVRTGWRNGGPFIDTRIFQQSFIGNYPPSLKLICCTGHGYDSVDLAALTKAGIWYCNTPNGATEAVANTGLYLILSAYRYYSFGEHCMRTDQWTRSRQLGTISQDPSNHILGIVGLGDIGLAIAQKAASALRMKIHYHNPHVKRSAEATLPEGATYHATLEGLVRVADCICLACPYTAATRHMLSAPQFALAKPSGLRIINVARGKLVDEDALVAALSSGKVVGWAADVHENEPSLHPDLKDNYMTTLLPHIGVCSKSSWRNFERGCLDNLEEFFFGKNGRPLTPLNQL